eukprot:TRINITY_DN55576_c0_g1_i1.p1 TRINITY_DN55576_c0_g1~~TRINITY_DN55576_c0_g1_i1.p1  ORF type:complete len:854 (-),score=156.78 TRINITY_DN55576_c0_g1_i1:245-2806(-)
MAVTAQPSTTKVSVVSSEGESSVSTGRSSQGHSPGNPNQKAPSSRASFTRVSTLQPQRSSSSVASSHGDMPSSSTVQPIRRRQSKLQSDSDSTNTDDDVKGTSSARSSQTFPLTSTSCEVKAGATKLDVYSTGGFECGDMIKIGWECRRITGFGSITIDRPLANDYSAGTTIKVVLKANMKASHQLELMQAELVAVESLAKEFQDQLRAAETKLQAHVAVEESMQEERNMFSKRIHEWMPMAREDERASLQRDLLQQVRRTKNTLAFRSSELFECTQEVVAENSLLADEVLLLNSRLEEEQRVLEDVRSDLRHMVVEEGTRQTVEMHQLRNEEHALAKSHAAALRWESECHSQEAAAEELRAHVQVVGQHDELEMQMLAETQVAEAHCCIAELRAELESQEAAHIDLEQSNDLSSFEVWNTRSELSAARGELLVMQETMQGERVSRQSLDETAKEQNMLFCVCIELDKRLAVLSRKLLEWEDAFVEATSFPSHAAVVPGVGALSSSNGCNASDNPEDIAIAMYVSRCISRAVEDLESRHAGTESFACWGWRQRFKELPPGPDVVTRMRRLRSLSTSQVKRMGEINQRVATAEVEALRLPPIRSSDNGDRSSFPRKGDLFAPESRVAIASGGSYIGNGVSDCDADFLTEQNLPLSVQPLKPAVEAVASGHSKHSHMTPETSTHATMAAQDASNSARVVGALLRQVRGLNELRRADKRTSGAVTNDGGPPIVAHGKAVCNLERLTTMLEHANHEWASLLVERGCAGHEWAALLAERNEPPQTLKGLDASSSGSLAVVNTEETVDRTVAVTAALRSTETKLEGLFAKLRDVADIGNGGCDGNRSGIAKHFPRQQFR